MTKKSAGRQARDAHLADNTGWDDLQRTSVALSDSLNFELAGLSLFFSQEPLMAVVSEDQRPRVMSALEALQADNQVFNRLHSDLFAKHQDKTGRIKTSEEAYFAQEIYTAYLDVAARYEQTSTPLLTYLNGVRETVEARVIEIEGQFEEARRKAAEEQAAAAEAASTEEAPAATEQQDPQA